MQSGDESQTAAQAGVYSPVFHPCRHCQTPVEQPRRRGAVKDFCSPKHRAAFRNAQVQKAIRDTLAAIDETQAEMERLGARLTGARTLLERYLKHKADPQPDGFVIPPGDLRPVEKEEK